MRNFIILILGRISDIFARVYLRCKQQELYKSLKCKGVNINIAYPFEIIDASNISIGDNVNIRANSCMAALNAKIIIKSWATIALYVYQ